MKLTPEEMKTLDTLVELRISCAIRGYPFCEARYASIAEWQKSTGQCWAAYTASKGCQTNLPLPAVMFEYGLSKRDLDIILHHLLLQARLISVNQRLKRYPSYKPYLQEKEGLEESLEFSEKGVVSSLGSTGLSLVKNVAEYMGFKRKIDL